MIRPVFIVTFTGHRSCGILGRSRADLEGVRDLVKVAFEDLRERAEQVGGEIQLFCSVAEGADVIAGEVAREMGISLHVILPLVEEAFREDFEGRLDQWPRSEALIRGAEDTPGCSVRVVKAASERPDCYVDTNAEMLEVADALVAVSTEMEAGAVGGAGHVCDLAKKRRLPLVVINPVDREVTDSDLERFAMS